MRHFVYYPKIEYSNNLAVNITVRARIREAVMSNAGLYYKYTIEDGERFDIISHKYYGNSDYVWAIFYANNIIDPVADTPKSHNEFIAYIKAKYGNIQSPSQTTHHYEYIDTFSKKTYIIDEATYYNYLGQYEPYSDSLRTVRIVSQYDYEFELNESKRNIVVLDKQYLGSITNELENIFV
ncbi:MAG: hypothetical protein ACK5GV_11950 [Bacteroidota bacterium]|jgi:hypothetical protein